MMKTNPQKGMVWVVVADIHANYPALQRVQADAEHEAAALGLAESELHYISLGDVVDYGPQPLPCLKWVESKEDRIITILGNHDLESARCPDAWPVEVQEEHWPLLVWTRCQLAQTQRHWLYSWPSILTDVPGLPEFVLAHSDLETGKRYLRHDTNPDNTKQVYDEFFAHLKGKKKRYGLIGHTHQQIQYRLVNNHYCSLLTTDSQLLNGWQPIPEGLTIFNPGSVGQPRILYPGERLDTRAHYLLLDTRGDQVLYKFRRVIYPIEETLSYFQPIRLPNPLTNSCDSDPTGAMGKLTPKDVSNLYSKLGRQLETLKGFLRDGF